MTIKRAYNCLYADDPKGYGEIKDPKDDLSGITPLSMEVGRSFNWQNHSQSTVTDEHLSFNAINPFKVGDTGPDITFTALVNDNSVNAKINDDIVLSEINFVMGFNGKRMDIKLTNIPQTGSKDVLVQYLPSGSDIVVMRKNFDITSDTQWLQLTDEDYLKYVNDNDGQQITIKVFLVDQGADIPLPAAEPLKMQYIIGVHKDNNQSELKMYFETGGFWLVGKRAYFNLWWVGGPDSFVGTWVNIELDHGRPMIDLSKVTVGSDSYAQLMTKSLNLEFDVDFNGETPPSDLGDYSFVGVFDEGEIRGSVKTKAGATNGNVVVGVTSYLNEDTTNFILK